MRARAPGKLVLSGAYSVLEGAPALVAAVDRYALADSERAAELVTAEVRQAIDRGYLTRAPWFDASALRQPLPGGQSRKLGLGSSAAILIASLAAAGVERTLEVALECHRAAQGGGSGIDVAASFLGGVLRCRLAGELACELAELPPGLVIEVLVAGSSASTAVMLEAVRALAARRPDDYRAWMDRAGEGARQAALAGSAAEYIEAVGAQCDALGELGAAAGVPIVTAEVAALDAVARLEGARAIPAGAGGGDVALFVGTSSMSEACRALAGELGLDLVPMQIGAPGAAVCP